jgi:uncharacterized membrane protein
MRRMLAREQRMVDMQIMAALQNGTAFFATTSLFAIGGALTILRSTDEMVALAASLPFGIQTSRVSWELKTMILLGAMPPPTEKDTPEADAHVLRAARLFTAAARHFNRGQRAFFFALGYLGWFAGPAAFLVTTCVVDEASATTEAVTITVTAILIARASPEKSAAAHAVDKDFIAARKPRIKQAPQAQRLRAPNPRGPAIQSPIEPTNRLHATAIAEDS